MKPTSDGKQQAPNHYLIIAHPAILSLWQNSPRWAESLGDALSEAGREAGLIFRARPSISTAADSGMPAGELRVIASITQESLHETQDVPAVGGPAVAANPVPSNAFLIIEGTRIHPLTETVTNIGRRLDNQVVIDDPRVSRNHAQLRVIKGRFVIFDLDSTGGLFLNGQRVNQSVLYPGDVISLAGVTLVFGQDIPSARQAAQGPNASEISAARATVFLKREKDESK
jgi:hypothetical protein